MRFLFFFGKIHMYAEIATWMVYSSCFFGNVSFACGLFSEFRHSSAFEELLSDLRACTGKSECGSRENDSEINYWVWDHDRGSSRDWHRWYEMLWTLKFVGFFRSLSQWYDGGKWAVPQPRKKNKNKSWCVDQHLHRVKLWKTDFGEKQ